MYAQVMEMEFMYFTRKNLLMEKVWSTSGRLIGKIALGTAGCGDLVLGPAGTLFVVAETRIYRVDLASEGAPE